MDTLQPYPSLFAHMVDKLRTKNEAELKSLYLKFFASDLKKEWEDITKNTILSNTSEEDIIKAIQQKRQSK